MAEISNTASELATDKTPEAEIPDLGLLIKEHMACLRRGDILGSLRHAIIIVKTARQTQAPIPQEIMETVRLLRQIRGKAGEFDRLFSKLAGAMSAEIQAERREFAARLDQALMAESPVSKDNLKSMSTADLIRFASTLGCETRGRTANAGRLIDIQRIILARDPHDIEARIYLVRALLNAGMLDEAAKELEEVDRRIAEENIRLTEVMAEQLRQCKTRTGIRRGAPPYRYKDFKEDFLHRCTLADLLRYSKQACNSGDWERMVYFTDKIHERPGGASIQNCIAHFNALNRLGRLQDALSYSIEVIGPLVENNPAERDKNARIIEGLRRRLGVIPSDYRDVNDSTLRSCTKIGEIVRWSIGAEQDGAWDRVAAFRRRLIELEPQNTAGYVMLGTALEHLGQFAEAIQMTREKLLPLLQNPKMVDKTQARIVRWARLLGTKENV